MLQNYASGIVSRLLMYEYLFSHALHTVFCCRQLGLTIPFCVVKLLRTSTGGNNMFHRPNPRCFHQSLGQSTTTENMALNSAFEPCDFEKCGFCIGVPEEGVCVLSQG